MITDTSCVIVRRGANYMSAKDILVLPVLRIVHDIVLKLRVLGTMLARVELGSTLLRIIVALLPVSSSARRIRLDLVALSIRTATTTSGRKSSLLVMVLKFWFFVELNVVMGEVVLVASTIYISSSS